MEQTHLCDFLGFTYDEIIQAFLDELDSESSLEFVKKNSELKSLIVTK